MSKDTKSKQPKEKKEPKVKKFSFKPVTFFLVGILLALIFTCYELIFMDKFFPTTHIGDSNVTFLTKNQAYQVVSAKFDERAKKQLTFNYNGQFFTIDLATSSAKISSTDYIDQAFLLGHQGNLLDQLKNQFQILTLGKTITPPVEINLDTQLALISKQVNKPPKESDLHIRGDEVVITESTNGSEVDITQFKNSVQNYLVYGTIAVELPLRVVIPNANTTKAKRVKILVENLKDEPIILTFNDTSWTLNQKQVASLVNLSELNNGYIDPQKLDLEIKGLVKEIDQPVVEALFTFDPVAKRVTAFKAGQTGQTLDQTKTIELIKLAVDNQRPKNITLPVEVINPKTQTADVNDLGINELLGKGISNFAGSIPNRIYNVNLTATKINGVLVPPGQIFSFNQTVGDISAATGFKQAYVIKEGRTVLDDGGGVCQDSTTLFRAVLNAGLPIVKRTAHAYRVGYYEQGFPPGLDATVFYPSVDFQFKNDTPKHILIQAYTDGLTLYIDLYGTSDGRNAILSKPVINNQTPPPPDLRQDDPTLPRGIVKQVDFSAWGANVSFTRTVVRNGENIIYETWRSNYKPWQAIYLVGTKDN